MKKSEVQLFPHLNHEVVKDISGFKLCSYLVALEGWRRGLELKWYKDETELCKMDRLNSSCVLQPKRLEDCNEKVRTLPARILL